MQKHVEKIQPNGMLPIPIEIQEEFHLTPGTEVKFVDRGNEIGIRSYGIVHPRLRYEDYLSWHLKHKIKCDFDGLEAITDKWGYIRQLYMENMKEIMMCSEEDFTKGMSPYLTDWSRYFSPIEENTWQSIRNRGIPLYPQFPVFNYFIDFANPYLKIGLEVDGKDYHDRQKDRLRDGMLLQYGWRIFRVTGAECSFPGDPQEWANDADVDDSTRDERVRRWLLGTNDGVVHAIGAIYFGRPKNMDDAAKELCMISLETHRLTDFALPESTSDLAVRFDSHCKD